MALLDVRKVGMSLSDIWEVFRLEPEQDRHLGGARVLAQVLDTVSVFLEQYGDDSYQSGLYLISGEI